MRANFGILAANSQIIYAVDATPPLFFLAQLENRHRNQFCADCAVARCRQLARNEPYLGKRAGWKQNLGFVFSLA